MRYILSLLVVLSASFVQVLNPIVANAASDQDNAIIIQDNDLITGSSFVGTACSTEGIPFMDNYMATLNAVQAGDDWYAQIQILKAIQNNETAGAWAVTFAYSQGKTNAIINFTTQLADQQPQIKFRDHYFGDTNYAEAYIDANGGTNYVLNVHLQDDDCSKLAVNGSSGYEGIISGFNGGFRTLFQKEYVVQYPDNYEGEEIPDAPIGAGDILRPNIVADVNDKKVSIKSKVNNIVEQNYPDYKIYWFITNANFDGEGPAIPFSQEGYSNPDEYLTFDAPSYEVLSLQAYFVANDGSPLEPIPDYIMKETAINITLDGSIYSVDSDNNFNCNENNFCEHESEQWEPEECDWWNPLTYGGCISNLIHGLLEALGILPTARNPTGSPFVTFTTDTKGLAAVITAPLSVMRNLSTSSYGCNPLVLPLPHLNRNLTLPCLNSFYSGLGGLYTVWQTILTGIIAYYVLVQMLAMVKGFKDPKSDRIEVTAL